MTKTTTEIFEFLLELVQENWGLTAQRISALSGLPRWMVLEHLRVMVSNNILTNQGGTYVASR